MQPGLAAYFMSDDSPRLIESVQAAERAGYRRAWLNDAHTLWQDVYVHMTRVLDATSSISVGSGVTNLVTRHFSVAASAHGTLAQLHPGRVVMGLGRGDASVHTMGVAPMSTTEFGRQTRLVRRLLRGEKVSAVEGKEFRIRWLEGDPVPIMIGATGPRNLRLAGGVADIVQLEVGVTEAAVRWGIEHVRAGAEEAGRDPEEVAISIVCAMWVADELGEARSRCRWAAASAANHIEEVMRRADHGMPQEMTSVVERRRAAGHRHSYDTHLDSSEAESAFLTDELIDNFAIAGSAERCRARLDALARIGVSEVASGFFNGELDQLRRVGTELIAR
jgi:alkanesulfonate monooxygenase SsuD/methylene tetrahydromethanopterin reductase-like flavin-dependent oxidoreductase (luciferase family)